ncbi:WecB/TagA/CpsF family glycosyltransferase [Alteromonas sp. A081]|uniref:WecB/TagA/CpsF family glycosyltransferase n=1 Tax=Alteromonas sp. A081 TaxID=3410269 RepID=UPI003B97DBF2
MKSIAEKISPLETQAQALSALDNELANDMVSVVSFINAHAYTMAHANPAFKDCLLNSNLLFRDGIGAKILLSRYNKPAGYNANGTDLIPLLLSKFKGKSVCFIGTESPYIEQAATKCKSEGHNILAHMDGFQDNETMFEFVEEHQPDILILGMGMPKQEYFAAFLQKHYANPLVVVNGGAIFDFMANRFSRAPSIFRKLNLEWLYRLMNEPVRLFNRYVIGIPKFFWLLSINKRRERIG